MHLITQGSQVFSCYRYLQSNCYEALFSFVFLSHISQLLLVKTAQDQMLLSGMLKEEQHSKNSNSLDVQVRFFNSA